MAEEDEIDVLGDCSLDSFLPPNETLFETATNNSLLKCDDILVSQNTELLQCDYTIHPQWLLDKPSANPACWYNTNAGTEPDAPEKSETGCVAVLTESATVDKSGWTEKEKNLLRRGIEIFGKSNARLSQFVGSKTPTEVKNYLKKYSTDEVILDFVEETVITDGANANIVQDREVLSENEIPASIEEVIAAVSTANPTVTPNKSKRKQPKISINLKDIPGGQSLLKKNYQTLTNANDTTKSTRKSKTSNEKKTKCKFKTKINIPKQMAIPFKKTRRKPKQSDTESVSDVEIVTGNGLSVPVSNGEEVIKIQKEDVESDSDVEIDIEDSFGDEIKTDLQENKLKTISAPQKIIKNKPEESKPASTQEITNKKKVPDLAQLSEEDVAILMSTEHPRNELRIDSTYISTLERFIHYEFFEGRPAKTPSRYLKIRNHILNVWNNSKPSYVTKTSIRHGLKQCGDVNCISRIHQYLEQIGAINFNCQQTNYVRPLYELVIVPTYNTKDNNKEIEKTFDVPAKLDNYYRNRNRKKFVNDGEGGYTLQHDDKGEVINTTIINEDPVQKKQYVKKPTIRLIYCRPFTEANPQDYSVTITLSTLLLMDLHSHSSLSEIMGLIGGHWNATKKHLKITRYEPCKNVASSATHCDMCPVTQAKAADNIHRDNMKVAGWFHSHPTFAPEPSQQDVDTQLSVQRSFGAHDDPCVGVIMTPFGPHGALIASPHRCMVVARKENFAEDQYVPFKLRVDVESRGFDVEDFLNRAWNVFNNNRDAGEEGGRFGRVDFEKEYFLDKSISYLDKFISSVKMHLAKCSDINKMTCDAIQQGLSDICCNRV